jgi:hypothetical protein
MHSLRDWAGLPNYISMGQRSVWMKRSDWKSLQGLDAPAAVNARIETRRFCWKYKRHWKLYHAQHRASNRVAMKRIFPLPSHPTK